MPRKRLTAAICLVALLLIASAGTAADENAAACYAQAVAKLPVEQSDIEIYQRWSSGAPMHQIAGELLTRCQESFELLHLGATIDTCRWGGTESVTPERARILAEATALHLRSLFEQRKRDEAAGVLRDLVVFGRRLALLPSPEGRSAAVQVEWIGYVATARYLPGLPKDVLTKLAEIPGKTADPSDPSSAPDGNVRRAAVDRALFSAAILVVGQGRAALSKTRDPAGDGPFVYDVCVDGFQLRSKLTDRGTPVVLRCGPQAFE